MQRKRNIRLLISLVSMITLTSLLLFFMNSGTNSFADKGLFQIDRLEQVDQVVLESADRKTALTFNGAKWMVNGKYEADRRMVDVLFATLKQTIAKRPVAANLRDSIKKALTDHGTKISCSAGGTLLRQFVSGGNAQKSETYFQQKDETPYVVTIPGYRVYVASIFELTAGDWRDKRIFNFNWQNIKSLEVDFPEDATQSFKASFHERLFSIEGIVTDTTKLDAFMNALFQIRLEKFVDSTEVSNYRGALDKTPLMKINIQDIGNQIYPLTVFPLAKGTNVVVGKINNEVILINPFALKELYRKKGYFRSHE